MKKIAFIILSLIPFIGLLPEVKSEWPVLKGPYLGQKPPGITPEIFAPEILATDGTPFNSAFSPDGYEFYYSVSSDKDKKDRIWFTRRIKGVWTKPKIAPFSGKFDDCDVSFSTDGQRLFFISLGRPLPGQSEPTKRNYMWSVERTKAGWSKPQLLEYPGNRGGVYPMSTENKTLYFSSRLPTNYGKGDIYRTRLVNGIHTIPENMGPNINSKYAESDAYVTPDESFMIITRWQHPENTGGGEADLYISFIRSDGSWSKPVNLGCLINSKQIEFCPSFSPDGKYFFFSKYIRETNDCNIYWVDAKIIEELKPGELK